MGQPVESSAAAHGNLTRFQVPISGVARVAGLLLRTEDLREIVLRERRPVRTVEECCLDPVVYETHGKAALQIVLDAHGERPELSGSVEWHEMQPVEDPARFHFEADRELALAAIEGREAVEQLTRLRKGSVRVEEFRSTSAVDAVDTCGNREDVRLSPNDVDLAVEVLDCGALLQAPSELNFATEEAARGVMQAWYRSETGLSLIDG
ncbi:hypothetical protein [Myxococcus sp. XM-1-1-1]|uniref:hypothetical protein n=1 Tax=Myxococcus sp. XM-1-1-1 TaxID=2874602 RepID=UPI001CBFEA9D|nr:hypothetical protein [Myxococcus sp. XM-1-1-1]